MDNVVEEDGRNWKIWKTIRFLEKSANSQAHQSLYNQVRSILLLWAETWAGRTEWKSLLNKTSFQDETQESMAALYFLDEWRKSKSAVETFVAVDVCGGKGIFSMLLQYHAALHWREATIVDRIILIDKASSDQIDWSHLNSKPPALNGHLPKVELWADCDLHDVDRLFERLNHLDHPLAFTGIHLCKLLSPALISLVNMLGTQCWYCCIAPCCMPRAVISKTRTISKKFVLVRHFEAPLEREKRLATKRLRQLRRRMINLPAHATQECQEVSETSPATTKLSTEFPCWNCGLVGHFRSDCKVEGRDEKQQDPPGIALDVSFVMDRSDPFKAYCELLSTAIELNSVTLIQVELKGRESVDHRNWNSHRKNVFIVARREG